MRSATESSQNRGHWPQKTPLMLVFITALLLDVSWGQQTCGNGKGCPEGYCCNNNNLCGTTEGYCGAFNCSSQCPPGHLKCGPLYNGDSCPDGMCCSNYNWCGSTNAWCGAGNCMSQCTSGPCGFKNDLQCRSDYCCSIYGSCGNTSSYCGATRCSAQCPLPPTPAPTPQSALPTLPSPAPTPLSPFPTVLSPVLTAPSAVPLGLRAGGRKLKPGGNKLGIIVGTSMGILAFLAACTVVALYVRRTSGGRGQRGWASSIQEEPMMQLEGMPQRFSYKQLSVATKAFSPESKLGQGGFGSVFRGVLPSSGIAVAVKKISSDSSQGGKEFMAEVSIISQLRHRNLIQLQGWCKDASRGKYLLVYELMPNGSLDKALYGPAESQRACLSWPQRFNIVTGTAAALEYLHQGWEQQVIHRDIKSSNIMLDEQWNAKLGDFGLARLVDHNRAAATTVVVGTYGYIAPEIATSGKFTDKTDVFAFGATLLEIACGRRPFWSRFSPSEIILVDWVWQSLSEGALLSTVDKRLEEYDPYWMEVVLMVGLLCSHPDPLARPSMRHVVQVLAGDVPVPPVPTFKPTPTFSSDRQNALINSRYSPKSKGPSKSRSGSISLVSTNTFDSTRASTPKSVPGTSSNSNSSFSRAHSFT